MLRRKGLGQPSSTSAFVLTFRSQRGEEQVPPQAAVGPLRLRAKGLIYQEPEAGLELCRQGMSATQLMRAARQSWGFLDGCGTPEGIVALPGS